MQQLQLFLAIAFSARLSRTANAAGWAYKVRLAAGIVNLRLDLTILCALGLDDGTVKPLSFSHCLWWSEHPAASAGTLRLI
jgi:hypothetical protein